MPNQHKCSCERQGWGCQERWRRQQRHYNDEVVNKVPTTYIAAVDQVAMLVVALNAVKKVVIVGG